MRLPVTIAASMLVSSCAAQINGKAFSLGPGEPREGTNCAQYEQRIAAAIEARNIDGLDGAAYYQRFLTSECSSDRAEQHAQLIADARKRVEREKAEARLENDRVARQAQTEKEQRAAKVRADSERRRNEEAQREGEVDEADWVGSNPEACADARTLDACNRVRAYLKKHPNGKHSEDAQKVIAAAEPRLAILRQEADWAAIDLNACRRPQTAGDCDPVQAYVQNHPAGPHRSEALAVLRQSEKRIASLEKSERAREGVAESIQELCEVTNQLEQLESAARMQRRVDDASGTANLYQRRKVTEARLFLGDRRQVLRKTIARAGVQFDQKRDCPDDESE